RPLLPVAGRERADGRRDLRPVDAGPAPASRAGMRYLLLLALWATLAVVPSWLLAQPWQHAIAAVASRLASPAGAVIEIVDLQLYYPFDLGIYLALCLASTWVRWGRRWRAVAAGLPVLILVRSEERRVGRDGGATRV